MDQSLTLLSVQVHFLDVELTVIHIPLPFYNFFIQPILHMLLPSSSNIHTTNGESQDKYDHTFLNISITPIECSVVCSRALAKILFIPVRDGLEASIREQVTISKDDYIVMQVDGEGLDAGQRVVELTSPLAMNKIPLFFISTYFSDYILVPKPSRSIVVSALEDHGLVFESQIEAFVSVPSPFHSTLSARNSGLFHPPTSSSSTTSLYENPFDRFASTSTIDTWQLPPQTPPPSSLEELQTRTFSMLKRRNILPNVDPSIRLIQCAERKPTPRARDTPEARIARAAMTMRMQMSLVKCLISIPRPKFFSLTLTSTEAASLLLERRLLTIFGAAGGEGDGEADMGMGDLLLGDPEEVLVPIVLDLRDLPMESTGIVCGIAGRLVSGGGGGDGGGYDGDQGTNGDVACMSLPNSSNTTVENFTGGGAGEGAGGGAGANAASGAILELSYLSTARAGAVIVAEAEMERAMGALGRL